MSEVIEGQATESVALFSITDAMLAKTVDKYDVVVDASTKEGYETVKSGLSDLVGFRTSTEAERKKKKQPYLDKGKELDTEAKRIIAVLAPIEKMYKDAKQAEDKKIEIAKQKRLDDLRAKIAVITQNLIDARGKDSAGIQEHIQAVGETDCLEGFYDLTDEAIQARADTLADLKIMLNDVVAREQLAADQAELAKQKAEFEASKPKPEPVNIDISAPIQQPLQQAPISVQASVREFIQGYNKKNGFGEDDDDLIESILDNGKVVYEDSYLDEHRWYACREIVVDLDGVFIKFMSYIITGDASMDDMDLHYSLEDMAIVQRKERTVIEVYYD